MAHCENPICRKSNLPKADVEYDADRGMILCLGCYCQAHPGWVPNVDHIFTDALLPAPQLKYEVSLSSSEGFRARLGYGDVNISFHAPMAEIKRVLG